MASLALKAVTLCQPFKGLITLPLFSSGVVSVDVALSDIDINQCDNQYTSEQGDKENLIEFMGTHLCKPSTKARACE